MFGNTASVRAALGTVTVSPVPALGLANFDTPVPGVAEGDLMIPFSFLFEAPVVITGVCVLPGQMRLSIANPSATPIVGGAIPLPDITIIKHTGST